MTIKPCSHEGCHKRSHARGLCRQHYLLAWRHKTLPAKQPYSRLIRTSAERFSRLLAKSVRTSSGCLEWSGARDAAGYGVFSRRKGQSVKAHRMAYEIANGSMKNGLVICHRCDNPSCVDIAHLFIGTIADNNLDCRRKGRAKNPPDQKGENHSQHIMSANDVKSIRLRLRNGERQASLMREYRMSRNAIHKIATRKSWNHLED